MDTVENGRSDSASSTHTNFLDHRTRVSKNKLMIKALMTLNKVWNMAKA